MSALARRCGRWMASPVVAGVLVPATPAAAAAEGIEATSQWLGSTDWPTGAYDIGYNAGLVSFDSTADFAGIVTSFAFSGIKAMSAASMAVIDWAFTGELALALSEFVDRLATRYHADLAGGAISVFDMAMLACVTIAGFKALRGRAVEGLTEVALSFVVLVIYLGTIATPGGFGDLVVSVSDTAASLSGAVATATMGDLAGQCPDGDPDDAANDVICPLREGMHTAFVRRSYDQLNWGGDLGDATDPNNPLAACAAARDEALATGPHGTEDAPRTLMADAGCDDQWHYQEAATFDRALLALMITAVTIFVLAVAAAIAVTLLIVQVGLSALVIVAPFAIAAGMIPGAPRGLLFGWGASLGNVVIVTVGLATALGIYLVTIDSLMVDLRVSPFLQFIAMIAVTIVLWVARGRITKSSKHAASTLATRARQAAPGVVGGFSGLEMPRYRGLRPGAYTNPNTRRTIRDVKQAAASGRKIVGGLGSKLKAIVPSRA